MDGAVLFDHVNNLWYREIIEFKINFPYCLGIQAYLPDYCHEFSISFNIFRVPLCPCFWEKNDKPAN
jgi:hypothetical protein